MNHGKLFQMLTMWIKCGLNVHIRRKHATNEIFWFPKIIKFVRRISIAWKTQRSIQKTQSYIGSFFLGWRGSYKCKTCHFTSERVETMEAHIGKCNRTEDFECGLWEFITSVSENLEVHLTSCGIYECEVCELRSRFLKDIKTLILFGKGRTSKFE